MPKQPNYSFEKRRREQIRQAKKDAKQAEKLQRKQEAPPPPESPTQAEPPAE